jgi:DNA-binding protein HU-beta
MSETSETSDKFFKRHDLVAAVAEKTALPRTKAVSAVDAVFEAIEATLKSGQEVRLVGFGSFTISDRKAGKGRDPRTGAEIDIPSSKSVRFRAGKSLKEAVGAKVGKGGKKKKNKEEAAAEDDAEA